MIAKSGTAAKPTTPGVPLPATDTVTVVSPVRELPSSAAVTVTAVSPSSSSTRDGSALSVIPADDTSSSTSSTSVLVTGRSEAPVTAIVSSASSWRSFSGVSAKVPVPLVSPAAIMIAKSGTAAKPTASGAPLAAADTVTVVATSRALASRAAVTATAVSPASSRTRDGSAASTILADALSSSTMAPSATKSSNTAFTGSRKTTTNVSFPSCTSSSTRGTSIVCAPVPGAKVSVPSVVT